MDRHDRRPNPEREYRGRGPPRPDRTRYRNDRYDRYEPRRENSNPYRDSHRNSRDREPRSREYYREPPRDRNRRPHRRPQVSESTLSIEERPRSFTRWDIKPPEFANVSAQKAKLLGLFTPLGPVQPEDGPVGSEHKEILNSVTLIDPKDARVACTVIVLNGGNHSEAVVDFIELFLSLLRDFEKRELCARETRIVDKDLVLVLPDYQTTTIVVALTGHIIQHDDQNFTLDLHRPGEYIVPTPNYQEDKVSQPYMKDTATKLTITNIAANVTEPVLQEALETIAQLRYVSILTDKSGTSKGIGFAEFDEKSYQSLPGVIEQVRQITLQGQQLRCELSCSGHSAKVAMDFKNLAYSGWGKITTLRKPTCVIELLNMVDVDSLLKLPTLQDIDSELKIVEEDVRERASMYGTVVLIKVPRLDKLLNENERFKRIGITKGFGNVFVKFETVQQCETCFNKVSGTKYNDRSVVTTYYSERDYDLDLF